MTFKTGVTEFAEFLGAEIKRIEKKIPDGGGSGSQSSDSMIITGIGRPDKPETTSGKITGREPNGTFYSSTNGAGVGAYLWLKQNNKWVVTSADTGERRMIRDSVNIMQGFISLRRVNNTVECTFTGGAWGSISFRGSETGSFVRKNHAKRMDILPRNKIPQGFRSSVPFMLPFYSDEGDNVGMVYVGSIGDSNYIELRFKDSVPTKDLIWMRLPVINWITPDPYPETLP
jgi:hypothetical protein